MNPSRLVVPYPLGRLLRNLPGYPGSVLFAGGLNLAFRDKLQADVLQALDGKVLRIHVIDAEIAFEFGWKAGRFSAYPDDTKADLIISANAHDFLLLLQRKEDPDTLFFCRRLLLEGDTELGLLVKNTLDAIKFPLFDIGKFLASRQPIHPRNAAG